MKAVCKCKNFSEDDLVVGVPKKRGLAKWGGFMWFVQICLTVFSGFLWLFALIPYELMDYFMNSNKYECQYCGAEIEKRNIRE